MTKRFVRVAINVIHHCLWLASSSWNRFIWWRWLIRVALMASGQGVRLDRIKRGGRTAVAILSATFLQQTGCVSLYCPVTLFLLTAKRRGILFFFIFISVTRLVCVDRMVASLFQFVVENARGASGRTEKVVTSFFPAISPPPDSLACSTTGFRLYVKVVTGSRCRALLLLYFFCRFLAIVRSTSLRWWSMALPAPITKIFFRVFFLFTWSSLWTFRVLMARQTSNCSRLTTTLLLAATIKLLN